MILLSEWSLSRCISPKTTSASLTSASDISNVCGRSESISRRKTLPSDEERTMSPRCESEHMQADTSEWLEDRGILTSYNLLSESASNQRTRASPVQTTRERSKDSREDEDQGLSVKKHGSPDNVYRETSSCQRLPSEVVLNNLPEASQVKAANSTSGLGGSKRRNSSSRAPCSLLTTLQRKSWPLPSSASWSEFLGLKWQEENSCGETPVTCKSTPSSPQFQIETV
mmetsp:Transcript_6386/g.22781  ORF Transcript_6386/g.22781 Transcript_6386/m.22781 type:complete len:227 (+) Transcript_6386:3906-4586(+)